jgi:hypothetical protein
MYQCVDAVVIMLMRTTMPLAAPPGVRGGVAAAVAATSGSIRLLPRRPGRTRQLPASALAKNVHPGRLCQARLGAYGPGLDKCLGLLAWVRTLLRTL